MEDIMSAMLGGGFGMSDISQLGGGRSRRQRKGKDLGLALPVTLNDLYNGKSQKIPFERQILCEDCNGTGAKKGCNGGTCGDCKGNGVRVIMKPMGPGMVQQMQVKCDKCNGQGISVSQANRCTTCNMKRVKMTNIQLDVKVEKGMLNEEKIEFPGFGDQSPDIDVPGSVFVVLQEEKHAIFTRDGNDLKMNYNIKLVQALCGFAIKITHLDGRILFIKNAPGQIINHKDIKTVRGEGMPIRKKGTKGDLIIEFNVEFPFTVDDDQIEVLNKCLPLPPKKSFEYDHLTAQQASISSSPIDIVRKEMEKIAADEDEDENAEDQSGVKCAQQ